ncbi:MAG: YlbF family regulator [Gemmatimonadaceae bacterium]
MSILEEKARDLGRLIGQTPEYQTVKRANDALSGDRTALDVLQKMEQIRLDAQRMMEGGEEPTPEMQQELDTLLDQVQGNPVYQGVAVAQENYEKVMMRVNDWIVDGIKKGSTSPIITLG